MNDRVPTSLKKIGHVIPSHETNQLLQKAADQQKRSSGRALQQTSIGQKQQRCYSRQQANRAHDQYS
jgi:hypothetical protein